MSFLLVLVLVQPGTFQLGGPVLQMSMTDCIAAARSINNDAGNPRIGVCAPVKGEVAFAL